MPPRALVVFVAFAVIALLASRTCGSAGKPVTQQQAVEIARKQIDYQADGVNVRFLRRGVSEHPFWAVSLWTRGGEAVTTGSPWSSSTPRMAAWPR